MIDCLTPATIEHSYKEKRFLLSAATRAASDAGRPESVADETLELLISKASPRSTLFGMVDRALLLASDRTTNYWTSFCINDDTDWPLIAAKGPEELTYLLQQATDRGYIEAASRTISAAGWERIESIKNLKTHSRQAFVAMWFDSSMDDVWLRGIKPGIEETGRFDALRIDLTQHNEKIDDRIIAEIRRSGLLVADFTGHRGGVYFEAGFAMGLGIPVIWTCRADCIDGAHFDTRQYNHIIWNDFDELRTKLRARIDATVIMSSYRPMN